MYLCVSQIQVTYRGHLQRKSKLILDGVTEYSDLGKFSSENAYIRLPALFVKYLFFMHSSTRTKSFCSHSAAEILP